MLGSTSASFQATTDAERAPAPGKGAWVPRSALPSANRPSTNDADGFGRAHNLVTIDAEGNRHVLRAQTEAMAVEHAMINAVERQKAVEEVARGVNDVNAMFKDLALLVQAQGKDIDTIEDNASSASESAARGLGQLHRAREHQPGCIIC